VRAGPPRGSTRGTDGIPRLALWPGGGRRALAGTDPDAPDLAQPVGELLLKNADFARLWERYDVRPHRPGTKRFHHPQVGALTLGSARSRPPDPADRADAPAPGEYPGPGRH
jgi:MmyB-like transcription regulator ligand binding domain